MDVRPGRAPYDPGFSVLDEVDASIILRDHILKRAVRSASYM